MTFRTPVDLYAWVAVPTQYQVGGPGLIFGTPAVLAGAMLGQLAGQVLTRQRERAASRPRWHLLGGGEVRVGANELAVDLAGGPWDLVPYRSIQALTVAGSSVVLDRPGLPQLGLSVRAPTSLATAMTQAADGRWWQPPTPRPLVPLNPAGPWCQPNARFTFALPSGWEIGDRSWLQGWTVELNQPVVAGAFRDTDVRHSLVIGVNPQESDLGPDDLVEMRDLIQATRANGINGEQIGSAEVVTLGGELAVSIHFAYERLGTSFETAEVWRSHAGRSYVVIYLCAPRANGRFATGLAEAESALGTWRWLA